MHYRQLQSIRRTKYNPLKRIIESFALKSCQFTTVEHLLHQHLPEAVNDSSTVSVAGFLASVKICLAILKKTTSHKDADRMRFFQRAHPTQ